MTGIAGRTLDEVLAGDSLAAVNRLLEDAAAAMAPVTTILHERDEQRSTFREVTAKPQIDARGAISSYLLAVLDVTERNRLEQELRQANEDFGSIVAQTPIMLSRVDRDLRQVWALSGIRGLASDAQESSVLGAGLPAPARELIQAWAREAMETEEGLQRTLPVADEGDERVFSFSVQPMRDGGVVVGASVVGLDITGHAQMMAALSQSERRYRRLIEATTACVWHMDASLSAFREPSATWKTTTGIERPGSREEFLRAFHDDDREAIARRLEEAAASGERVQMDARLWHEPSSRHRWVQLRLMPLTQVGQGLLEWVGAALDVDDRVRARLAVTEGREELKTLLDILPAVVFIAHDSEGNRITGNQAARRLLRMPDADELSMTAAEGARPQHFRVEIGGKPAAPGDLPVQWAARQGRDWVGEEEIFFDDGAVVTLVGAARPLRGPTGSVRGAVAAFVDISVQKRLEQSLRASQVRFETFMANLPAYAWIRDASGRIVYANEQLQRDLPLFADNRLELPAEWQTLDLSARGAGSPIRASVASPEGGVDDTLLLIKFPMVEADEVLLGGIGVDITEQTRTGKALARSERRVRAIADSGNVGLWQWDGGETTLWSKTMCGFFGIPCETDEEEIALGEVSARLHPDDLERLRHAVRELTAVGHGRIEIEFRVVAPEAPLRWIALSGLLYPAGEERAAQMQGVTFDITERVQAAEALARTRQRINQIANTAKVGMWEWDGGDAVVFNRPMCELHGVLAEADEVRVPLAAAGHLVHPDDRKADAAELVRLIAAGGGDFYSEARVLVPDHAQRVVATSAKVEVNSRTGRATILGISYDVTQQWELARLREASRAELEQAVLERTQDVALASDQLRAEAAQRRTAEEQLAEIRRLLGRAQDLERVRLAHDLHDGPLQELTALSMELTLLGRRIAAGNEAASLELLDLRDRARQVALTLRAFAGDLRPPVLDSFGIAAAVQAHAEAMEERYPEVKITLEIPDEDIELEESVQTTLFRVFQQALFNVYRHAKATTVHVRLAVDDDEAALEVMDDGGGFEVPDSWISLARAGHLGIVGMAERAAAVGGRLHVESAPGRGTTVIARVPSVRPDGQEGSAPGR